MTAALPRRSSSVALRLHVGLLPLEGRLLVEREELEEELDLEPAPVEPVGLEQDEHHDDEAVDRALQSRRRTDAARHLLDAGGFVGGGADHEGDRRDHARHVVLHPGEEGSTMTMKIAPNT